MPLPAIPDGALPTSTYAHWDFDRRLVGDPSADKDATSNKFASAKSILVCAGPERANGVKVEDLQPIGLLQDFNLQQNTGVTEIFEIGSRGRYFIQGRPARQVTLSRLLFYGPSLMRALYEKSSVEVDESAPEHTRPSLAGDSLLFLNLASKFFEKPTGLLLRVESIEQGVSGASNALTGSEQIGSVYLEEAYIRAHSLALNANQVVVGENVTLTFDNMVPLT